MTAARPDTWMPLYWGDYMRDTGHLSALGHGAYLMLIKHYWCTGEPLNDDDDELWRIACCDSKDEWLALRPKIIRLFRPSDGLLRHKRVDEELAKAVDQIERQRARTAAATEARKGKTPNRNDERHDKRNVKRNEQHDDERNVNRNDNRNEVHRAAVSPSPSPSSLRSEEISVEGDFEAWYASFPRHVGKGQALKAYRTARKNTDVEALLTGAKRYAAERAGEDDKFTKHPATWLNGQCWLDEAKAGAQSPAPTKPGASTYGDPHVDKLVAKYGGDPAPAKAGGEHRARGSDSRNGAGDEIDPLEIPDFLRRTQPAKTGDAP